VGEADIKKSLGQHWLHDEESLNAICDAARVRMGDTVLEIGPGLGTLTEKLLVRGAEVIAVEFDHSLAKDLQKNLLKHKSSNSKTRSWKLSVIEADILKFDFGSLPPNYKVVANIPYYLTSNLLRIMSEAPNHFSVASLLVQKEVAERVCANPGDMSLLSVSVQLYCDTSLDRIVPAALFTPPPKVDSQILILEHLGKPRFEVETKQFFRLVKAGFSERRKMLRSSLSGGLGITKVEAEELLQKADIDPTLRAQALSLVDWEKIYKVA
jgi:16S rRNA (adenine1518-N6/adenine1519-N6)-dimethyltransferase